MTATRLNQAPNVTFASPCHELTVFTSAPLSGGVGFALQATDENTANAFIAEFTPTGYKLWQYAPSTGWQQKRTV